MLNALLFRVLVVYDLNGSKCDRIWKVPMYNVDIDVSSFAQSGVGWLLKH